MTLEEEERAVVKAAALYMDRIKPGWARKIDVSKLDIEDPRLCVCGQNGLVYREVWRDFAKEPNLDFDRDLAIAPFVDGNLRGLWLKEIAARVAK